MPDPGSGETDVARALRDPHAARDPGEAPRALRERVERVTDAATGQPGGIRGPRIGRLISGAAAATLILIGGGGLVIALLGGLYRPVSGSGSPTPPPFDPNLAGIGMVATPSATVPWLLAILGAAACLIVAGTRRRRARLLAAMAAAAFVAVPAALSSIPGPGFGYLYGPGQGLTSGEDTRTPGVFHVVAGPGQPFSFVFGLRNQGPLPVTVAGLIDTGGPINWTALWLDGERTGAVGPTYPFTPITIDPVREVTDMPLPGDTEHYVLWAIGRTGSCTEPPGLPGPRGGPGEPGSSAAVTTVHVAWTVLGWPRDSVIELPITIAVPLIEGCADPDEVR